jgi:hypothetical protein
MQLYIGLLVGSGECVWICVGSFHLPEMLHGWCSAAGLCGSVGWSVAPESQAAGFFNQAQYCVCQHLSAIFCRAFSRRGKNVARILNFLFRMFPKTCIRSVEIVTVRYAIVYATTNYIITLRIQALSLVESHDTQNLIQ